MANMKLSLDTRITRPKSLQLKSYNPKNTWRARGRGRSGNGGRQQKQLNSETPCDLRDPRTLEHILPAVCKKKTMFSASLVPQPAENHTYYLIHPQSSLVCVRGVQVSWVWMGRRKATITPYSPQSHPHARWLRTCESGVLIQQMQ